MAADGEQPGAGVTAAPTVRRRRRIVPVHPAVAVLEYHLAGYRRAWRGTVFSSFVMPVLFFLGFGVAVGSYVDQAGSVDVPYIRFVASGLLASTAMQVAMMQSGTPVLDNFRWQKMYHVMAAAPPRIVDILVGQLGYVVLRVLVAVGAFLLVMVPFGVLASAWTALAPAVAVLVGLAVATPMLAYSATVNNPSMMAIMFRFGMLPMALFSGVFFPVDQLPAVLLPVVYASPLWHGVELCRAAVLGIGTAWPAFFHLGVLGLWFVAGFVLARARFIRRLAV